MPAIIKEDKQVKALNEVEEGLAKVRNLTDILSVSNQSYRIDCAGTERKHAKVEETDPEFTAALSDLLARYRKKLAADIRTTAKKHRIALDDSDEEILNFGVTVNETEEG